MLLLLLSCCCCIATRSLDKFSYLNIFLLLSLNISRACLTNCNSFILFVWLMGTYRVEYVLANSILPVLPPCSEDVSLFNLPIILLVLLLLLWYLSLWKLPSPPSTTDFIDLKPKLLPLLALLLFYYSLFLFTLYLLYYGDWCLLCSWWLFYWGYCW